MNILQFLSRDEWVGGIKHPFQSFISFISSEAKAEGEVDLEGELEPFEAEQPHEEQPHEEEPHEEQEHPHEEHAHEKPHGELAYEEQPHGEDPEVRLIIWCGFIS